VEPAGLAQFLEAAGESAEGEVVLSGPVNQLYDEIARLSVLALMPEWADTHQIEAFQVGSGQLAEHSARLVSIQLDTRLVHLLEIAGTVRIYTKDMAKPDMTRSIRYFVQELQIDSSFNGMERASRDLYDSLISPFVGDLRQAEIDTLIITATGCLRAVPYAALYSGSEYLLEDFTLQIAPIPAEVTYRATGSAGSSAPAPSSANDALQISLAEESLALSVSRSPVTAATEANRLLGAHYSLGLPANLASLWSTNPTAHEKLMADYRDGRAAGLQPATALQAAQRAMQASPRFGHPYFWGGYLLAK
jgi:CHAT domain-containing protein